MALQIVVCIRIRAPGNVRMCFCALLVSLNKIAVFSGITVTSLLPLAFIIAGMSHAKRTFLSSGSAGQRSSSAET
jgi:hypothetical protein